jgi:predicted Zn-dependent protease
MNKSILQGVALLILFFGLFYALSFIDFTRHFNIDQRKAEAENSIGNLIWNQIQKTETEVLNDSLLQTLDSLLIPICKANKIERDSIKLHFVVKDEVNAFALPNNHLVVYTGLIQKCQKQESLQGVLGHEVAHIQNNHVMKKLSKEVGLSVILSATAGEKGGAIIKEILKKLSSSAYDRNLEKEADISAVDYLVKAKINPKPLADFMFELAQENVQPSVFSWIASHPESEERAKYILSYSKQFSFKSKQTITDKSWKNFQNKVKLE